MVVKKSNGNVRICADYSTGLNDALEPDKHPLPTPDEIFCKISGGSVFSHIDLSDAFLQVEIEDESRHLLTINTHLGLYQFNRLPAGIKPAPNVFQKIMDAMLSGLNGTAAYIDDIIVTGRNPEEHKQNLYSVLNRIKEYGFRLKWEKCKFFMLQIKYLGHVIDSSGIRPDKARIEVIEKLPVPKDLTTLRSFLGAINYCGKFVKSMKEVRGPLDELLKKDSKWNWSQECQQSFQKLKKILTSDLLLVHQLHQKWLAKFKTN